MFWHESSIKWKLYSEKVLKKSTLTASHSNNPIIMPPKIKQNSWICFKDLKHAAPPWGVKLFPCESATLTAFSPLTCDWRNQWCQVLCSWVSPAAAFHPSSFIARRTSRQDEGTSVIFMLPNQLVNRRRSLMSYSHLRDATAPAETVRVRKKKKKKKTASGEWNHRPGCHDRHQTWPRRHSWPLSLLQTPSLTHLI